MTQAARRGRPPKSPQPPVVEVVVDSPSALPGVEVVCTVREVHTGDGRVLYRGDRARVSEEIADVLVKLETVERV